METTPQPKTIDKDLEIQRLEETVSHLKKLLKSRHRTPTHGNCCTCQRCGLAHDDCRCDVDDVAEELDAAQDEVKRLVEKLKAHDDHGERGECLACGHTDYMTRIRDEHKGSVAILKEAGIDRDILEDLWRKTDVKLQASYDKNRELHRRAQKWEHRARKHRRRVATLHHELSWARAWTHNIGSELKQTMRLLFNGAWPRKLCWPCQRKLQSTIWAGQLEDRGRGLSHWFKHFLRRK